jgi:hypothetical protein
LNEPGRDVASDEVTDLGVTPAPYGMLFDTHGNLYMADLESNSIVYRTPAGELKNTGSGSKNSLARYIYHLWQ